jgi:hypothetical protein
MNKYNRISSSIKLIAIENYSIRVFKQYWLISSYQFDMCTRKKKLCIDCYSLLGLIECTMDVSWLAVGDYTFRTMILIHPV